MCALCTQLIWLGSLFNGLGFPQGPTTLFYDNKGTIACIHNLHSHSQMKHINIRVHFILDCVNQHLIDVHHIPGIDNIADVLTKPLNKIIHAKWLKCLQMDKGQGGCWRCDRDPHWVSSLGAPPRGVWRSRTPHMCCTSGGPCTDRSRSLVRAQSLGEVGHGG
jgi:hypothetical protein